MNLPIHPATQVLVVIPGSPQAPTLAMLSDIANARRMGQLPATAVVQFGPHEPWLPVDAVLARTGLAVVPPMPTRPLLVALFVVPPIWALLHALVFDAGVSFLLLLWGLCVVVAMATSSAASLRSKSSKDLFALLRARPAMWWGALATFAVCETLALGAAGLHGWRRGVAEAALAEPKDCDFAKKWASLSDEERDSLDSAQQGRAYNRLASCERHRADDAAEAYAAQCKEVGTRLAAGQFTSEDRTHVMNAIPSADAAYLSGTEGVELADRIARRALKSADLTSMAKLPCGSATKTAYLHAVAQSPTAWAALSSSAQIGDDVLEALGAEPTDKGKQAQPADVALSDEVKAALHRRAEDLASTTKAPTTASAAENAAGLCMIERRLGGKWGPSCTALASTVLRLRKAEALAQKAAEARCKAAISARQRCMRACDARQPQDELGMPAGDFDEWLACGERCEQSNPASGCE